MQILVYLELAQLLPSHGAAVSRLLSMSEIPFLDLGFLLSSFDPSDLPDPGVNFLKKFRS
jgi:hypothetical protein